MSYITVPAELVITCCNNWKAYWGPINCHTAANIIAKVAKEKQFIIFGKEKGYQKAFEELENSCEFGKSLTYHSCFWKSKTREIIDNLLRLAENGDPVVISDKHSFIFDYKE